MHRSTLGALVAACTAVVVLALPGVASAHDPIIIDASQTTPDAGPLLPDGTISFALYGVLERPGDARGFRVRLRDGDRLQVSLLVPDLAPEQGLAPDELPTLRIDAPDGATRTLVPDMSVAFDEPFSGTRYLRLLDLDEPAVAGEYAITVTGARPARFTVSVGSIEQFGTPVEGVVDRGAGVAGVMAWYSTPPPDAAPATTPVPATDAAPATDAVTSAPPTTPEPTVVAVDETGATSSTGTEVASTGSSSSSGGLLLLSALVAVAVVAAGAVVRRRRAR